MRLGSCACQTPKYRIGGARRIVLDERLGELFVLEHVRSRAGSGPWCVVGIVNVDALIVIVPNDVQLAVLETHGVAEGLDLLQFPFGEDASRIDDRDVERGIDKGSRADPVR